MVNFEELAAPLGDCSAAYSYYFVKCTGLFPGKPIGRHDAFCLWNTWCCIDWFEMLIRDAWLQRIENVTGGEAG